MFKGQNPPSAIVIMATISGGSEVYDKIYVGKEASEHQTLQPGLTKSVLSHFTYYQNAFFFFIHAIRIRFFSLIFGLICDRENSVR